MYASVFHILPVATRKGVLMCFVGGLFMKSKPKQDLVILYLGKHADRLQLKEN